MPSPLPRQVQWSKFARRSPLSAAFPVKKSGRLLQSLFRGLLSVHSRYGLHARGVAKRPFTPRAPTALLPPLPPRLLPGGANQFPGGSCTRCSPAPFTAQFQQLLICQVFRGEQRRCKLLGLLPISRRSARGRVRLRCTPFLRVCQGVIAAISERIGGQSRSVQAESRTAFSECGSLDIIARLPNANREGAW